MTDRVATLRAAAARKHSDAITRTQTALREIRQDGEPITFQSVARRAGVSRQWLYQQPELRNEIERLRATGTNQPARSAHPGRASDASLRQRLKTLSEENQRLRGENRALKQELAVAYGKQRDAQAGSSTRPDRR
jgi:Family of unknown function (DUF6262)